MPTAGRRDSAGLSRRASGPWFRSPCLSQQRRGCGRPPFVEGSGGLYFRPLPDSSVGAASGVTGLSQFSVPWRVPSGVPTYGVVPKAIAVGVLLFAVAATGSWVTTTFLGGNPFATLFLTVGPAVTGVGAFLAAFVVKTYRAWGRLLFRWAGVILLSAVVVSCVGVWLVNTLFAWVTGPLLARADDPALTTWFHGPLTIGEMTTALPPVPGWVVALLWPLQFPFIRDLTGLGALVGLVNVIPVYAIWWERKVAGRIQSRLGPMRVGGWHGWAQSVADGIKLVLKEDLIPAGADRALFRAAPYFAMIPAVVAFLALPFGGTYVFRQLDVALVFILGILGIEVVGVIIAGWASNNKWSVYGAMREACQMVSYEIPMGMALLVPVVCVGSLSLQQIGDAQAAGWFSWLAFRNPFTFIAFVSYYIASLASCKRAPFDLPEAESELVAGFHTEYSGLRWSFFFFAEYAAMFLVSGLASILFLGAWHSPLPLSWGDRLGDGVLMQGLKGVLFSGPIWFLLKCVFFIYVQIWLRWTLPRIRIDQVLYSCVQVMLPLTMLLLLGNVLWVWASDSNHGGWVIVSGGVTVVLGLIGAVFMLGFAVIAAYGFYHRRKLVGNLVVDVLPGA